MLAPASIYTTALIASLVALGPLSTDMYLPAFPALKEAFSADIDQVQRTLSVFMLGFALAQLVYGPLSDRFGRKPVLVAGIGLFSLSSLGILFAQSIEGLTLLRLLQAIGGSAGPVLGRAMVRDIHGPRESARLLSYIATAMALAPAAAPVLGGFMTVWFGWSSIFLFLACYGLLGLVLLHLLVPETAPRTDRPSIAIRSLLANYGRLLRHPTWRWYTLCCSFVFGGLFSFLSGAPFVIIEFLGHSEAAFGLFFTFIVVGFMAGTLIGGRTVRRVGSDRLIGIGAVIAAVNGVLMALLALGGVHHAAAVVIPHTLFMVGVGIVMPQSMAGALAPFPQIAGTSSALLGFVQMSLAAAVGVLVGHYHDGGPASMALAIAAMGLLTLFSFRMLRRSSAATAGAPTP